jgi:hypothetical protein
VTQSDVEPSAVVLPSPYFDFDSFEIEFGRRSSILASPPAPGTVPESASNSDSIGLDELDE